MFPELAGAREGMVSQTGSQQPRCGCSSAHTRRVLEELFQDFPNWLLKVPTIEEYLEGIIDRTKSDSSDDVEDTNNEDVARTLEPTKTSKLPRQGRGKSFGGFGCRGGGRGNWNWGRL